MSGTDSLPLTGKAAKSAKNIVLIYFSVLFISTEQLPGVHFFHHQYVNWVIVCGEFKTIKYNVSHFQVATEKTPDQSQN